MDHSAFIDLIAPDGRYLGSFAHGHGPDAMAAEIQRFLENDSPGRQNP